MKIGSLFSGIGGLELGLEWAGVGTTAWQVEIDPYCRGVLAKHWPDAEQFEDVTKVGAHNLSPVDVICGGFPCQDISYAGDGAGIVEGTRSGLWLHFARIIRELRPRFVVVENVAALLDRGMGIVLGHLAEGGYDAEWTVLRADECGVPQSRPRVFIIASPARSSRTPLLHHDALYALGNRARVHGARREASHFDHEGHRASALPLLGNPVRPQVPDGERGGTDGRIPRRVDRYTAIGNAVVPQVAEVVGQRLLALDAELRGIAT